MKCIFRPISCLYFALIVSVLALSLPVHMVQAGAVQIEICGEFGPELRWIDGSGEPLPVSKDCIKCLLCNSFVTPDRLGLIQVASGVMLFDLALPISVGRVVTARYHLYPQPQGPPIWGRVAHDSGIEKTLVTLDESHLCKPAVRFQTGKAAA